MKLKVLAIDDDPLFLSALKVTVEFQEWTFSGARSGKEGVEAAKTVAPDIILLDVSLPDAEGWDLCQQIRAFPATSKVPILLISGQRKDSEDIIKGLKSGADDYLPKPVSPVFLVEKIKTIARTLPRPD